MNCLSKRLDPWTGMVLAPWLSMPIPDPSAVKKTQTLGVLSCRRHSPRGKQLNDRLKAALPREGSLNNNKCHQSCD